MKQKGFTLVELLAVIAILAILVIIALPNVVRMFNEAKKGSFLTEVKTIYKETAKKYISESMKGNKLATISSKDSSKLDMTGEDLDYCVILDSQGKVEKIAVGNKSFYLMLSDVKDVNSMTKDDIKEGTLSDLDCNASAFKVKVKCEYDGEPVNGTTYQNDQYTYIYNGNTGWAVKFNDTSSSAATSEICSLINGKPIVSTNNMFYNSKAKNIDLSTFDTSNVTDMSRMFYNSAATTLDLRKIDTSKVTNMSSMFYNSAATTLDLSSFDTSNVSNMSYMFYNSAATTLNLNNFNTSSVTNMGSMFYNSKATTIDVSNFDTIKVTNMGSMFYNSAATTLDLSSFNTSNVSNMSGMFYNSAAITLNLNNFNTDNVTNMNYMFYGSQATNLDLSSFDTSKVTNMGNMFYNSKATKGYARTQADADKFNNSSGKPSGLNFVVRLID